MDRMKGEEVWKEHKVEWILAPSVLGHIFITSLEYDLTISLILGRVYGGQRINGQSLHRLNPLHKSVKLYKIDK